MEITAKNLLEYLNLRHIPENINIKHQKSLGVQDRIALLATSAIGTMYAVYVFALFMLGWMLWQSFVHNQPFDPFPFAFLLFLGNIIQLLMMPLIMVGQNLQGRHAEIRAEEEFKTTESSSRDIEQILLRLELQDKQIQKQTDLLLELSNNTKKH